MRPFLLATLALTGATPAARCSPNATTATSDAAASRATLSTTSPAPAPEPVEVVELPVPGDLPGFVLRGAGDTGPVTLFIPGRCAHPQGFMQAFQFAARRHGRLLGIQGDIDCGGGLRRWSSDLASMQRRIDALLAAAAIDAPTMTLMGYSQGAERAEWLRVKSPRRYRRLVLMSGPIVPRPDRLRGTEAIALLAGERESQTNMRAGARELSAHGIPAQFFTLPNAPHGALGTDAESALGQAFRWLDSLESPANSEIRDQNDDSLSHSAPPKR